MLPMLQASLEDYFDSHALQIAYCKSAKENDAIALGRKILQIEDRAAIAKPAPPAKTLPSTARRGNRKIIAYSLWGASPVYNYGAMINARLAPCIYPGWKCRFYLGQGVPDSTRVTLAQAGAEIVEAAGRHTDVAPAMWRFLVADDPGVAIFLCRDCDARLSPKEAAAVDVWLRSGKRAHRKAAAHRAAHAAIFGGQARRALRRRSTFSSARNLAGDSRGLPASRQLLRFIRRATVSGDGQGQRSFSRRHGCERRSGAAA